MEAAGAAIGVLPEVRPEMGAVNDVIPTLTLTSSVPEAVAGVGAGALCVLCSLCSALFAPKYCHLLYPTIVIISCRYSAERNECSCPIKSRDRLQ